MPFPGTTTRVASFVFLAALLLAPPAARADDSGAPESEPRGRWYGWELMLSDALFLMVATDGNAPHPELPIGSAGYPIGLAGVIVGAPALHYLHGNPGRARVGLVVRGITVPLFALAQRTLDRQSDAVDAGVFVLGGLGFAAAGVAVVFALIDDIWYARAPAPPPRVAVAPTWFAGRGGGGVGLLGLF